MDITARIRQLEELIAEAKNVPLSASIMLNRDEMLGLLEDIRQSLPEEIKQARWVVRDREELLTKARKDVEALIGKAKQEQARLIAEQEVVRRSQDEAERILSESRALARQVRNEADDYVDGKLASFEIALGKAIDGIDDARGALQGAFEQVGDGLKRTLEQVERGRERLQGSTIAEEELAGQEES